MIGRNDCSGDQEISSILKQYELLLEIARTKSSFVRVAGICPRTDRVKIQTRVAQLNDGLANLCKEHKLIFKDSMPSFLLQNGDINDGYFLPKGLHLSQRDTEMET